MTKASFMTKHAGVYRAVCLVAALLAIGFQEAGAASPQSPAPMEDRIAEVVTAQILAKGVPSASVAVMGDGRMLVQRAWGVTDVDRKTQADPSTTYQIASSSKQFTAALVLKQVDRGRIALDDSITRHLQGLKPEFAPITIEQLLNHTSGLANEYRDPAKRLETRTPAELRAMVAATSLTNTPGAAFLYSNTGYALLGMLIEELYGKSYADALRDEIAVPLGLTLAKCAEPRPGEANGYMRSPDGTLGPPPGLHHSQMLGVGGICATPGDLVKWTHALHTGKVLAAPTYTAMTTPRGAAAASNYGFGTYVRPAAWGGITMTHGGVTTTGHVSELQWYPAQSVAYSLLYNVAPRVPGISDLIPRIVLNVQPSLDERVGAIVKSEILAKGVPSVSAAVMRDGKMLLDRAWGVADVEKNVSASAATVYPIGSVAKQFTAALVLKQVERGRLALADPIGKHLARMDGDVAGVTIEQLLNHTSGLKRSVIEPDTRFEKLSADALLAKAAGGTLETKAGSTFTYSNAGYAVLGVLVEKLYGKTYGAALQDEIAGPLGLTTLRQCADTQPGDARGYGLAPGGGTPGDPPGLDNSQYLGSGGVCASAADLVKWTHALHTGRVLSAESYAAMTTPRGAAAPNGYGFGLDVTAMRWGPKAISHGGQSITGHIAELYWFPEHALAVAMLYNVFPRVSGIADLIPRIVLGAPLPEKISANAPATAAAPAAATTPAERSALVGVYEISPGRTFEVTLEAGSLYVTPGGSEKQPLVFLTGNTYALGKSDSTTTITFVVENGVVTGFEANANGNKRMLRKIVAR
jgi:D-alanyl-D-alanine carboxypeptidase